MQQSDSMINVYTFFFIFFSIMAYHRILNIAPFGVQWDIVTYRISLFLLTKAKDQAHTLRYISIYIYLREIETVFRKQISVCNPYKSTSFVAHCFLSVRWTNVLMFSLKKKK